MHPFILDAILRRALEEDIGTGDVTTLATISSGTPASAELVAKEDFILSGIGVAQRVFQLLSSESAFEKLIEDGQTIKRGDVLAWIKGDADILLQGERVALNFLQRMSGISTLTSAFVSAVQGTGAKIVDTRKTTPGLRVLEKYAVRMGGGSNHRMALYDAVLIKENHIAAAGGITKAIKRAKNHIPHTQKIEVEVRNQNEVQEALDAGADILLLDNMTIEDLRSSVAMVGDRAVTEASGGINLDTVREIAETGVNLISVGALTHSYRAVDISMLIT